MKPFMFAALMASTLLTTSIIAIPVQVTNFPSNQQVTVTNLPKNQNVTVTNFPGQTVSPSKIIYVLRNSTVTLQSNPGGAWVSLGNVSIQGTTEVDVHVYSLSTSGNNNFLFAAFSAPDATFPGLGSATTNAQNPVNGIWLGGGSQQMGPNPFLGAFMQIDPTGSQLRLWALGQAASPTLIQGLTVALYLIPQ